MKYIDIIRKVSSKSYYSYYSTKAIIDDAFGTIVDALKSGESVTINGFGTFKAQERAPRTGRNPHTGEEVPIPAQVKPVFKPSKELIREVQECLK